MRPSPERHAHRESTPARRRDARPVRPRTRATIRDGDDALPSGTVTFLFTDIEGSTAHWELRQQAMEAALRQHNALVSEIIAAHGGRVFKNMGDEFCTAFQAAPDAFRAALEVQRALHAHPWGELGELRVRVGLLTGAAEPQGHDYVGPVVNRVKRLIQTAGGGQIVLGGATADLVRDQLPPGVALRDLGEKAFRDVADPIRVYEATAAWLPARAPVESPPIPPLRAHLLNGFRVELGDRSFTDRGWRRQKACQVLKYLLTHPHHRVSSDQLFEIFWPESDPQKAASSLGSNLTTIREMLRTIGFDATDLITRAHGTVRIHDETSIWVDADAFEETLGRARQADDPYPLLEEADRLYAGHFLPDDLYEDWATPRREALKRLWSDLQRDLARLREARGEVDAATAALRRRFEDDATDELAARELMALLARHGRRTEALRVYECLVAALRKDLDAEPSPESVELRDRLAAPPPAEPAVERVSSVLRAPTLPTARTGRFTLPAQTTPFIGREREVAAARDLLRNADARLLTFTGPGGTGKTRLALRAASEMIGDFADGVCFVDLAPIAAPDLVVPTIAQALDVREVDGRTLAESLALHLRDKRMLLLLDNFEQVLEAGLEVSRLLAACPGLKVLVTSRAVLNLYGEHDFQVPPLPIPEHWPPPSVEELAENPAVRLFVDRARACRREFALDDDNAAAIAGICRRLDGLPLAIELAAARIKLLDPHAILARLHHRLSLLIGGPRDSPRRQQTLRQTIDWSHDLLTSKEKILFRRLAVFVGGCPPDALAPVVGDPPEMGDEDELMAGVESLVDKSLVLRDGRHGHLRFTMLATIREYALEQLRASGEATAVQHRHADWCLALTGADQEPARHIFPTRWTSGLSLDTAQREHGNLRAALRWLVRNQRGDEALRLSIAMFDLWYGRGFFKDGLDRLLDALALPAAANRSRTRGFALWFAGVLSRYAGQPAQVRACHREALDIFRELGDLDGQIQALAALGQIAGEEGDHARARDLCEQAVALARESGNAHAIAWTLHGLGQVAEWEGDEDRARQLHEEALTLRRQVGPPGMVSWSLIDLAYLAIRRGDRATAGSLLADCPALQGLDDAPPAVAGTLECTAFLAVLDGRPDVALRLIGAAATVRETSGARAAGRFRERIDHWLRVARAELNGAEADASLAAGRAMTLQEAMALAVVESERSIAAGVR